MLLAPVPVRTRPRGDDNSAAKLPTGRLFLRPRQYLGRALWATCESVRLHLLAHPHARKARKGEGVMTYRAYRAFRAGLRSSKPCSCALSAPADRHRDFLPKRLNFHLALQTLQRPPRDAETYFHTLGTRAAASYRRLAICVGCPPTISTSHQQKASQCATKRLVLSSNTITIGRWRSLARTLTGPPSSDCTGLVNRYDYWIFRPQDADTKAVVGCWIIFAIRVGSVDAVVW
jgi:hypothetical protein